MISTFTNLLSASAPGRWSMSDHLSTLALAAVAVFAPLQSTLVALLFLVIMDTITGLWAAFVTNTPISSRKLSRTIVKTLVYLLTVCIVHVANKYLLAAGPFLVPLDSLITSFIALTELKSILENLQKIQRQPLLQFIIDRVASDASSALKQLSEKEEESTAKQVHNPEVELPPSPAKKKPKKEKKKNGSSSRPK